VSSESIEEPRSPQRELPRCAWVTDDPLYQRYHDEEWGRPEYDPQKLYERLVLEAFQAGLSWITILRKREAFRRAFLNFQPERVANFGERDVERLLTDASIIRHRGKIRAAMVAAQAWLRLEEDHPGGFSSFIWDIVGGEPRINHWRSAREVPATTPEAERLSRRLRKEGFQFIGPTTAYAFMQAAGLVNDHQLDCFCRSKG